MSVRGEVGGRGRRWLSERQWYKRIRTVKYIYHGMLYTGKNRLKEVNRITNTSGKYNSVYNHKEIKNNDLL